MTPARSGSEATQSYHHGDLRRALLEAARAELEASGLEKFSLRKVARRAGVSHAAPAHHFNDTSGLLTALAAEGFRRFVQAQMDRQAAAARDPRSQLLAAGLGYTDFALRETALFRLIHTSDRPDHSDPDLAAAAGTAIDHLVRGVMALTGREAQDPEVQQTATAVWSMVHGMSDLLCAGRLKHMSRLPAPDRDAAITRLLERSLPVS